MAEDAREDRAREPRTQVYEDLRPLLLSIAFGIVGNMSEAADIVQEAFPALHQQQSEDVDSTRPRPGWPQSRRGWRSTSCAPGHQGGLSGGQACCTASSASLGEPSIR